ncbi:MAG: hypothetical protein ACI8W3_002608, partial [Myxococcota bacterium]
QHTHVCGDRFHHVRTRAELWAALCNGSPNAGSPQHDALRVGCGARTNTPAIPGAATRDASCEAQNAAGGKQVATPPAES